MEPFLLLLFFLSLLAASANGPTRHPTKIPVVGNDDTVNGSGVPGWSTSPIVPPYPGLPPGTEWSGVMDVVCQINCGSPPRKCTSADICGNGCFCLNAPTPPPTPRPNPPTQNPTITAATTYQPTPSALLPQPDAPSLPPSVIAAAANSIPPWQIGQTGIPTFAAYAGAPINPLLPPFEGFPGSNPAAPSARPSNSARPTALPTRTKRPTKRPSARPTPTPRPSQAPSKQPTQKPTAAPSTRVPTAAFGLSGGSTPGGSLPSAPSTPPPTSPNGANAGGAAAATPLSSGTIAGIVAGVVVLVLVVFGAACMRGREAKEDSQYKFWLKRKIETGTLYDVTASPVSDEQRLSTVADYHDIYSHGRAGRFGSMVPPAAGGGGPGGPGGHGGPGGGSPHSGPPAFAASYQPYVAHLPMTRTSMAPGLMAPGMMAPGMFPGQGPTGHPQRFSQRPPPPAPASHSSPDAASPLPSPPFYRRQSGPVGAPSPAFSGPPMRPPSPSARYPPPPRDRGSEGL